MARIVICVPALNGPINSTRKVARDLRRNGHSVYFVGMPDCKEILADDDFLPVFSNFFPAKELTAAHKSTPSKQMSLVDRLRGAKLAHNADRALIYRLVNGHNEGFEIVVAKVKPDMVLISTNVWYASVWALLAYRFSIPAVYLSSTLIFSENGIVPPIHSDLKSSTGIIGQLRTRLAWKRHNVNNLLRSLRSLLIANTYYPQLIRQLAFAVNFPSALLLENENNVLALAPELVLMPDVFDFPHSPRPNRYYTSASVDLLRPEVEFPWERLHPTLPVIYCALGTLPHMRQKEYVRFYRCVVEAFMAFCDEYQLVLAVALNVDPESIGNNLRNVTIVKHAPQIAILKQSVLAITHGGANSVKECVTLGVPMLIYPLAADQFGLSARAAFHGIALKGEVAKVQPVEMREAITKLLKVPYYRMQARRMQHEFSHAEENRSPVELIELFLSARQPLGHVSKFNSK